MGGPGGARGERPRGVVPLSVPSLQPTKSAGGAGSLAAPPSPPGLEPWLAAWPHACWLGGTHRRRRRSNPTPHMTCSDPGGATCVPLAVIPVGHQWDYQVMQCIDKDGEGHVKKHGGWVGGWAPSRGGWADSGAMHCWGQGASGLSRGSCFGGKEGGKESRKDGSKEGVSASDWDARPTTSCAVGGRAACPAACTVLGPKALVAPRQLERARDKH